MNWSTCMTKAAAELKLADNAFLLKDYKAGTLHLVKAQQWLAEVGRWIWEEKHEVD